MVRKEPSDIYNRILLVVLILFMMLNCGTVYAEDVGVIRGEVVDFNGKGIGGATIYLWNAVDNVAKQLVTDSTGAFRFANLPYGGYHMLIWNSSASQGQLAFAGINDIRVDADDITLGAIDLTQDFRVLSPGQGPFDLNDIIKEPIDIKWSTPPGKGVASFFLGLTETSNFMGADFVWSRIVDKGAASVSFNGRSGHKEPDGEYVGDGTFIKPGAYYLFLVYTTNDGLVGGIRSPLVLVDKTGPVIEHIPVVRAVEGADMAIEAQISDIPGVAAAMLFYRVAGDEKYSSIEMMDPEGTGTYRASVPMAAISQAGLDYYIRATDTGGNVTLWPDGGSDGPQRVTVVKGNAISGVVRDISNGRPLPGATIIAMAKDEKVGETLSSEDGSYLLTGLPLGEIHVLTSKDGYRLTDKAKAQVTFDKAQWLWGIDMAMSLDGLIKGRLLLNGQGAPGRFIYIARTDGSFNETIKTDEEGNFKIVGLPLGVYSVSYRGQGEGELFSWRAGDRLQDTVILDMHKWSQDLGNVDIGYTGLLRPEMGSEINLRELRKDGALPVEWARHPGANGYWVQLFSIEEGASPKPRLLAYTSETRFQIFPNQVSQGTYELRIGIDGGKWFGESSGTKFSFFEPETGKVVGRVIDAHTGEGLAGAKVRLDGIEVLTTGPDGRFITDELEVGTYDLTLSMEGYGGLPAPINVVVKNEEPSEEVLLALALDGHIKGYAALNGQGLRDVEVLVTDDKGQEWRLLTNNIGAFEFQGLAPGNYKLMVSGRDIPGSGLIRWEQDALISSDDPVLDVGVVELGYPGLLNLYHGQELIMEKASTGRDVIDFRIARHPGVASYNIYLKDISSGQEGYIFPEFLGNVGGAMRAEVVYPGTYELAVHGKIPGGQVYFKPISVTLISSSVLHVMRPFDNTILNEGPVKIEGKVTDSRIKTVRMGHETYYVDEDGNFTITFAPEVGKNIIHLLGEDDSGAVLAKVSRSFTYAPLSKITGRVFDASSMPVEGAIVTANGVGGTPVIVSTDKTGFFELVGMGFGDFRVQATPPQGRVDLMDMVYLDCKVTTDAPHFKLDLFLGKAFEITGLRPWQRIDINELVTHPITFTWEALRDLRRTDVELCLISAGEDVPLWRFKVQDETEVFFDGRGINKGLVAPGEYRLELSFQDPQGGGGLVSLPLIFEDKYPPKIEHKALDSAIVGLPLEVRAKVTDVSKLAYVSLNYRIKGEKEFKSLAMREKDGFYEAIIPAKDMTFQGIEYKIFAADILKNQIFAPESGVYQIDITTGMGLEGRVVDPRTGRGVPGAQIWIDGEPFTTTDEKGFYKARNLDEGHHIIKATRGGYIGELASTTRVTLAPGSFIRGVDLELTFQGGITGELVGDLLSLREIEITGPNKAKGSTLMVGPDGKFSMEGIPAGLYSFRYRGRNSKEVTSWEAIVDLNEESPSVDLGQIHLNYRGLSGFTSGQVIKIEELSKTPLTLLWDEYPSASGYMVIFEELKTGERLSLTSEPISQLRFEVSSWTSTLGTYLVSIQVHLDGGIIETRNGLISFASEDIVKLDIPDGEFRTDKRDFLLSGRILESSAVELIVNKNLVKVSEDGTFSLYLNLEDGENQISIQARDSIGTPIGLKEVTLIYDPDASMVETPGKGLTGRILKNGQPLPDREVLLMGQDASSVDEILFLEARTDSEGRYSFPDIPKGVFDVIYINITPPADEFYMVYSIQRVPEMGVLVNVPDMDVSNKITLTSPKPPRFFRIGEVQNKGIDFAWELSQDTGPVKKQFVGLFEIKDGRLNEIWGMQGGPDLNGALFKGELPQGVTLLPGRDYYLQIGFVREDGMLFTALYEIEFIG